MKLKNKTLKKIYQKLTKYIKRKLLGIKKYFCSKRFKVFLGVLFGACVISYFLLLFFAKNIEMEITFPGKDINLKEITNHPAGLSTAQEISFISTSGNTISGIYIDNQSEKVVYYFHGNGAPIEYFYSDIEYISDLGYSVIALEFPGYGKSSGEPTFEENSDFSEIFYREMQKILGFEEKDMVVWGYSVGTALAVEFAKDKDFDALILFSPLASRYDMSQKVFGFPVQKLFFLPNSYVSKETIQSISEATLIIHGNDDTVVPFWQGKLVFESSAAKEKYFIEIDGFGHSLIPERYGEALHSYIENFLQSKTLEKQENFLDRELATQLLEKYKNTQYIKNLDFISDDSLTKYVDPKIPFTDASYVPGDMRSLSGAFIIDTKGNAEMRQEAAEYFEKMAQKFYEDTGEKIVVVSSYRSYAYQVGIKSRGCPDKLCAKAGYSEHQSGLTADLWSASTHAEWKNSKRLMEYYEWLSENAHLYGFHNSYQNGRDIDGYEIEPWHWRYLGVRFASYLKDQDMTFAEHYYQKEK